MTRWRDDTTIARHRRSRLHIAKVHVGRILRSPCSPKSNGTSAKRIEPKDEGDHRAALPGTTCRSSRRCPRQWAARARASQVAWRPSLRATSPSSWPMSSVRRSPRLGASRPRRSPRGHDLLRFVLSRPYFDLRRVAGSRGLKDERPERQGPFRRISATSTGTSALDEWENTWN